MFNQQIGLTGRKARRNIEKIEACETSKGRCKSAFNGMIQG